MSLCCAITGDEAAVTKLLDEGSSPDAHVPQYKRTALHWSGEMGHVDVCVCLIERGATVNFQDRTGATPLHKAAWNGHAQVCARSTRLNLV